MLLEFKSGLMAIKYDVNVKLNIDKPGPRTVHLKLEYFSLTVAKFYKDEVFVAKP